AGSMTPQPHTAPVGILVLYQRIHWKFRTVALFLAHGRSLRLASNSRMMMFRAFCRLACISSTVSPWLFFILPNSSSYKIRLARRSLAKRSLLSAMFPRFRFQNECCDVSARSFTRLAVLDGAPAYIFQVTHCGSGLQ